MIPTCIGPWRVLGHDHAQELPRRCAHAPARPNRSPVQLHIANRSPGRPGPDQVAGAIAAPQHAHSRDRLQSVPGKPRIPRKVARGDAVRNLGVTLLVRRRPLQSLDETVDSGSDLIHFLFSPTRMFLFLGLGSFFLVRRSGIKNIMGMLSFLSRGGSSCRGAINDENEREENRTTKHDDSYR